MASVSPLTAEDIRATIQRFEKNGLTEDEKAAFIDTILNTLLSSRDGVLQDFEENLSLMAESVVIIDRAFNEIDNTFSNLAKIIYFLIYPDLIGYYNDWQALRTRWRSHLTTSGVVANNTINLLQRFDTVYLQKVANIQTEQDRLNAIQALGEFINERQDLSDQVSRGFLDLKRDVAYFLERFNQWLNAKGFIPSIFVTIYKMQIEAFQQEIEKLNELINSLKRSIAIAGSSLYFFDLKDPIISILIYMYQVQLQERQVGLREWKNALASLEQTPILQLKAKMDSWRPDLELVCERLVLFAEIWSSIRSQAVQFRGHIQGGMDAATNMRFKKEVQLARELCTPLVAGLRKYAASIQNHSRSFEDTTEDS